MPDILLNVTSFNILFSPGHIYLRIKVNGHVSTLDGQEYQIYRHVPIIRNGHFQLKTG